ncbi:mechanosensitive ion channel family protein [Umezakia ovalisporum]|jgi:small-conductance mechanosensitive channel|uniref:Mechanosensitive ion channel family protein n=2 Tax=Umezakia ovalisporum TaxID=75695 RepID=A0AA43H2S4_9CYAN|nr:mechanosensitive ion channel family protein [Umezakia ovalisporum]MBI1242211.1 mechanosensitive ion channel [Nostoc sp. RI_552]MDH6056179.1 mechanosensitive ion channel family protein [Umezakia ovalisporum FSS-43]MDH6065601.1 mechanosensitive ion channel family protein [Umezakia ovalisporum FSS-62]MDH6065846.1 mechanosensitive ion channel family protein [Umezakia ovalisporum APH033B]MDH6072128.1 mechanosensitive ion channel family protein [Umezakia ovalisporum CobakiLakeA]
MSKMSQIILQFLQRDTTILFLTRFGLFLFFTLLSVIAGRYTPTLIRIFIRRFAPQQVATIYNNLIEPTRNTFRVSGSLILISLSLAWIIEYQSIYRFISPIVDLAVISSLAWLASRIFRQFIRVYGIELLRKLGREVDELLLVFETLANVMIGFTAIIIFAQSQQFNLIGLLTGLGIGGLAIAFAAQKTLEQLLGTIVLYLDRPFIPGEYIRLQKSGQIPEGLFGRVESIGIRSSKIRTAAKSTLFIIPNSILANLEIENITRGKKVMVLLYLDFATVLEYQEQALVEQVVAESTNSLFGIDPGSTSITFLNHNSPKQTTRTRVTFFILGSSDNSLQLRKRLLELANEKISKKLVSFGIEFTMQEPTIYVDSPVTL